MNQKNTLCAITLNGQIIDEGFDVFGVIGDKDLKEMTAMVEKNFTKGMYLDFRILSAEDALSSEWKSPEKEKSHIIYVKHNEKHEGYAPNSIRDGRITLLHNGILETTSLYKI